MLMREVELGLELGRGLGHIQHIYFIYIYTHSYRIFTYKHFYYHFVVWPLIR